MAHEDDLRDEADGATAETARTPEHRSFGQSLIAGIKEVVVVAAMALTLSFLVKTFLFQAFYIPSESMEDTLVLNDRVIASKLTPGPFELHRGDVVVFLVGLQDGTLPITYAQTDRAIEEERRLLYVAMTRARDSLHLITPQRFYPHNQHPRGDRHVT